LGDGLVIGVEFLLGSSFFCAPARFKNISSPQRPTKTTAQKTSIPREDFWRRLGNWITQKNKPFTSQRQRNSLERDQFQHHRVNRAGGRVRIRLQFVADNGGQCEVTMSSRNLIVRLREPRCSDGRGAIQSARSTPPGQR
jgi:hypothetical protein